MKLPRRRFLHLAAGAAVLATTPRAATGQAWPNRVVRLVVGFPPGGGAGGNLAFDAVAHANPDGYTILMAVRAPAISRFLFSTLGYDPEADFAPVSQIGVYAHLLVVPNASPAASLQEFMSMAKANPGKVTFATPGVGTPSHLTAELLKRTAGFEMTHVPYRGVAAGAMNDLIAGRIDAMVNTTGSLLQAARSGQVRGLAISAATRSPLAPEFPTMSDSGVPGFDVSSWYALFAPAKTPPEIVKTMNADMIAILAEPAVKARLAPLGIEATSSTPDELAAKAAAETRLWGPLIKAANIRGE